jgi:hypothetical protein
MKACMGKDLTGEIAKSQAFLVFKSSYESTAVAAAALEEEDEDEDLLVVPAAPVPVPDAFP